MYIVGCKTEERIGSIDAALWYCWYFRFFPQVHSIYYVGMYVCGWVTSGHTFIALLDCDIALNKKATILIYKTVTGSYVSIKLSCKKSGNTVVVHRPKAIGEHSLDWSFQLPRVWLGLFMWWDICCCAGSHDGCVKFVCRKLAVTEFGRNLWQCLYNGCQPCKHAVDTWWQDIQCVWLCQGGQCWREYLILVKTSCQFTPTHKLK